MRKLSPAEVIELLNKIGDERGLFMTRQTLLRYEWQKLIPPSQRGSKGRGAGRWTDYPAGTVSQAFAAWCLIHGTYGPSESLLAFSELPSPQISPKGVALLRESHFSGAGETETITRNEDPFRSLIHVYEWIYGALIIDGERLVANVCGTG